MAATKISSLLVAILFFFVITAVHANTSNTSIGFTLSLIPPISPDSPFHRSIHNNLTSTDDGRSTMMNQHSIQYNQTYSSSNNVRIPMSFHAHWYVTKIVLGVPRKTFTLLVHSGSELTWIQCIPCWLCSPQSQPMFNPINSKTYKTIPCHTWVCQPRDYPNPFRCVANQCIFNMGNGAIMGQTSTETFWYHDSKTKYLKRHDSIVFGCSHHNSHFKFGGQIGFDGVLGINGGRTSITSQLFLVTNGIFSYCLRPITDPGNSLFKFGTDVVIPERNPSQTFLINGQPNVPQYHIRLYDIGFGSHRLHIPPPTFYLNQNGTGGCWLATTSIATHLPRVAYDMVTKWVQFYYGWLGFVRVRNVPEKFEFCYKYRPEFRQYIPMTYYLDDTVMPLTVENTYYFQKTLGYFCLPLIPSPSTGPTPTIIGVLNQQNMRFVFDCSNNLLKFVHANCAADTI